MCTWFCFVMRTFIVDSCNLYTHSDIMIGDIPDFTALNVPIFQPRHDSVMPRLEQLPMQSQGWEIANIP